MKRLLMLGAGLLLALCLSSCADLLLPGEGCGDCAGAHWENTCLGWIAPVCDTYCVSGSGGGVRLLDECCCAGKALPAAPRADGPAAPPAWRPLTARYE